MPGYKVHLMGGLSIYSMGLFAMLPYCVSYSTGTEWLLCSLAGSLFPDIDIKSKGQKYFYSAITGFLFLLTLHKKHTLVSCVSIVAMTPLLVRHRGIFHRLWFVIGAPLILWFLVSRYHPSFSQAFLFDTFFFIAGAISHLWLDFGGRRMLRV